MSVYLGGNRQQLDSLLYVTQGFFGLVQGQDAGSRIDMSGEAPEEAAGAERLAGPEDPRARGFTALTFARLRSSIEGWL